jgi:outer membrane receptor protein involved in Fe transport
MNRSRARAAAGALIVTVCARTAAAQQIARPIEPSLDSLLNTRISAASKYSQTSAEAPASVTVLTSDDIRQNGYRNLQEVLESVRGFYVSNDRNYPYLGTRGFGRPTDYNDRILILIDGHTLNEQVWGQASVGSDLPINLQAVERIEIVRGPGSALYGTNAMFGVINIVTKTGTELDGVNVSGRVGSGRTREAAVAAGRSLGSRGSVAVSGLMMRADGNDLYYPEFDSVQTNRGVVRGLDWERGVSGLASVLWRDLSARVGYRSRAKGLPTAPYEAVFGDPRAETVDETFWGEVGARRDVGGAFRVSGRVYFDRYRYRGVYPFDTLPPYTDGGRSTDVGTEGMAVWDPASRDRLTLGAEYRHVTHAEYYELQGDGTATRDNAPFNIASIYAQNELQLARRLTLVTGLRLDRKSRERTTNAPRLALIATPDRLTTIKLLYGEAFRSPSPAEADLQTTFYSRNPTLRPERISTLELEVQRRVGAALLVGGSVYSYQIRNLIDQVAIENGTVEFANVAQSEAAGIELQVEALPGGPVSAHATYAFQRTASEPGDIPLTNSPHQIANLSFTARRWQGLRSTAAVRYESGRLTLAGPSTPSFARTDLDIGYAPRRGDLPRWATATELSLRVTNLFDTPYSTPAGIEHRQAAIPQDGRTLSLRLDWRF